MATGILTVLFCCLFALSIGLGVITGWKSKSILIIRGFSEKKDDGDDEPDSDALDGRPAYIIGWVAGGLTIGTGYVLYFQWFPG